MSARLLLRALVASAALLTPLAPASAVETTLCLLDVDCVAVAVDANDDGSVEAQADTGGSCPADTSTTAACVPALSAGTSVSKPPPPPPPSGPHLYNGGCSHVTAPDDGRMVDVTARINVVPHGTTSVAGETKCHVYIGRAYKATVVARGAVASTTQRFLVLPYSVRLCTAVSARWSDGHSEGYQSAGRGCVPDHS